MTLKKISKSKKLWVAALSLACLLVVLRLSLESIVKSAINRQLAQMTDYEGHIDGVGLSFWRGAYQIKGLKIEKRDSKVLAPFLLAPWIDISMHWQALIRGNLVASVTMKEAQLNFVNGPRLDERQNGQGQDWQGLLKGMVPLKINRFRLRDSNVHFRDPYGDPPVDVYLDDLDLNAENLSSRQQKAGKNFASVSATCQVMQDAHLSLQARLDPLSPTPAFEYSLIMKGLDLQELNPLLLRYAGMDVGGGRLELYSEAAAAEGKFQGYFKPMITGLQVMRPHERLGIGQWLKKALAGTLGAILTNKKGQVATKFEFAGKFDDPQTSLWSATKILFTNAFIHALPSRLEGGAKLEDLQKKAAP